MSGEDPVTDVILTAMDDAGLRDADASADPEPVAAAPETEIPAPDKGTESSEPSAADEEAELSALEKELAGKEPRLAKGKISTARHQAVLTRARNKHAAELKTHEERLAKLVDYEKPDWALKRDALALAEARPDLYIDLLLEDERYQKEFSRRYPKVTELPAPVVEPKVADDPEPQPDRMEADGSLGWSDSQARKHSEWQARKIKAELKSEFDAKFAPIEKEHKAAAEEQRKQKFFAEEHKRVRQRIAEAKEKWPGYAEYETVIQEYFNANPNTTLYDSYIAVVPGKLKADREKVRAEERAAVIKEMNEKANPPARPGPGARPETVADPTKSRSVEDIILEDTRAVMRAGR